jgi:hypothetical protein
LVAGRAGVLPARQDCEGSAPSKRIARFFAFCARGLALSDGSGEVAKEIAKKVAKKVAGSEGVKMLFIATGSCRFA